jgi:hypothetical protein
MRAFAALLLLCLAVSAFAQDQTPPDLTGYVTRAASSSDFDVNGVRVLCGPDTQVDSPAAHPPQRILEQGCPQQAPYVGLPIDLYGKRNRKSNTIAATRIVFRPVPLGDVSSYAIVEAVLNRSPNSLELRADGYRIHITPATALRFDAPLHSLADVGINLWITYSGAQQPDGSILARRASPPLARSSFPPASASCLPPARFTSISASRSQQATHG